MVVYRSHCRTSVCLKSTELVCENVIANGFLLMARIPVITVSGFNTQNALCIPCVFCKVM